MLGESQMEQNNSSHYDNVMNSYGNGSLYEIKWQKNNLHHSLAYSNSTH